MRSWLLVVMLTLLPLAAKAQELASDAATVEPAEDLLSDTELDDLVAPVALYPDALLAQVLVAATYPLDVMKADRFLDDNAEVADKQRAELADAEDWDASVRVLTGGFPDVIRRMAEEIEWTEELGDAMLVQTDDLLEAVQRMRVRADAAGNLDSNEAQTVEVEGDTISITPADPQIVYVPTYDSEVVYTTPATTETVVYQDQGLSTGDLLTAGAIAFGSALLIDEIFDDDDDDYWYGSRHIDWDDDDIYPYRGGDVDIDEVNVNVDNDKVRIGDSERGQKDRERKWEADRERRDEAKKNIEKRKSDSGKGGNKQTAARPGRDESARPADDRRTQAEAKLKARTEGGGGQPDKLHATKADRDAAGRPEPKPKTRETALKPEAAGKPKVQQAKDRGATSLKKDTSPAATKARAPSASKPKAVSKPKVSTAKAAPRKPAAKSTAFKKPASPSRSHAASSRGHKSSGKSKRR